MGYSVAEERGSACREQTEQGRQGARDRQRTRGCGAPCDDKTETIAEIVNCEEGVDGRLKQTAVAKAREQTRI